VISRPFLGCDSAGMTTTGPSGSVPLRTLSPFSSLVNRTVIIRNMQQDLYLNVLGSTPFPFRKVHLWDDPHNQGNHWIIKVDHSVPYLAFNIHCYINEALVLGLKDIGDDHDPMWASACVRPHGSPRTRWRIYLRNDNVSYELNCLTDVSADTDVVLRSTGMALMAEGDERASHQFGAMVFGFDPASPGALKTWAVQLWTPPPMPLSLNVDGMEGSEQAGHATPSLRQLPSRSAQASSSTRPLLPPPPPRAGDSLSLGTRIVYQDPITSHEWYCTQDNYWSSPDGLHVLAYNATP
jgi:hypothetical protein